MTLSLYQSGSLSTSSALSPRDVQPQSLAAAAGDLPPDVGRPAALGAELGSPRPDPPRDEMKRVLVGEADGAMALVRDAGAEARGLAGTYLRNGDLEGGGAAIRGTEGVGCRARRGRGMTGQERELMLDRLEAADGPAELLALAHVLDGLREKI